VRAGLARRIVVKVSAPNDDSRNPADAGTGLPFVEISRVAAGDVLAVDSKVRVSAMAGHFFCCVLIFKRQAAAAGLHSGMLGDDLDALQDVASQKINAETLALDARFRLLLDSTASGVPVSTDMSSGSDMDPSSLSAAPGISVSSHK
jgi:hypothetical protein